jgi:hypothetical protein
MFHRTQQLRIDPGQASQRLRIQTIVFLPALSNQPHVTRMRHDHFMPQSAQQPADPRRVRPGFQSDPAARHRCECRLQTLGRSGNFLFQDDASGFIQNAIPAGAIAQVKADGQVGLQKIPALLLRCGANLLHCRSPLSLVLKARR